jgi:hypothetical protein
LGFQPLRYVFPRLYLHPTNSKNRISAAKAVRAQGIYGTAEAVPFVKGLFQRPVPPLLPFPDQEKRRG